MLKIDLLINILINNSIYGALFSIGTFTFLCLVFKFMRLLNQLKCNRIEREAFIHKYSDDDFFKGSFAKTTGKHALWVKWADKK
ncbi:MAG: hypothetical protein GY787_23330 [Alteromonadales bacterium]|nr:hypothetical protein [Alteromonadales bacterium]